MLEIVAVGQIVHAARQVQLPVVDAGLYSQNSIARDCFFEQPRVDVVLAARDQPVDFGEEPIISIAQRRA